MAQGVLESASLDELTLFVSRLRQIRDWLQQDSRLLPVVDEFIGQQVAASEKRNTRRNVAIASITTRTAGRAAIRCMKCFTCGN
jgi:hypothetical protein